MSRSVVRLDRNATWISILVVGALIGGRRHRRAALRGVIALGLASAVTRLGGRLTGRSVDAVSRLAVATAATAAAGSESGVLVIPGAGLLAAFASARTRDERASVTGAAVGLAVGVGAAAVTGLVWQRPADPAPRTNLRPVQRTVQPSPRGAGLTIVCNGSSGRSSHRRELDVLADEFPDANVVVVDDPTQIGEVIVQEAERAGVLGVMGGDGTIGVAAAAAHVRDIPLAVFPGGTLNHFARDLGIDTVHDAIAAVRAGELLDADVGMIAGRMFLNTASFGSYSEFVDAREQFEQRIGKWPAVMVALWRTVLRSRPIDVTIDGRQRRVWTIFIGNSEYDPPGFAPATRRRLDDGCFDVRIIDGTHPAARLRLVVAVLTGRVGRSAVYTRRLVERMDVVATTATIDLAADGEVFEGDGTFEVEKHPRPLQVYAPHL